MRNTTLAAVLALIASAALAHQGVKDPAVMARMQGMGEIGKAMKTLGEMAKGEAAFNRKAARSAAKAIRAHAAQTPALFEAPATDPKSEARPKIWKQFDDFTAKSKALEKVAADLSGSIRNPDDLRTGVAALGAACKACHSEYRRKK